MKLDQSFGLPALFGAIAPATEDQNHWILPLQFGELPACRGVVGKLIVGKDGPWADVGPHVNSSTIGCGVAKLAPLRLAAGVFRPRICDVSAPGSGPLPLPIRPLSPRQRRCRNREKPVNTARRAVILEQRLAVLRD